MLSQPSPPTSFKPVRTYRAWLELSSHLLSLLLPFSRANRTSILPAEPASSSFNSHLLLLLPASLLAFLRLFAPLTRSSTLSFPPHLLSSLSAPSTLLPPAPPLLSSATLPSTSPLLLLHSITLSLQPRLLLSAPLYSFSLSLSTLPCTPFSFLSALLHPLPFLPPLLYFSPHPLLYPFLNHTPCSTPSPSLHHALCLLMPPFFSLPSLQLPFSLFPTLAPPSGLACPPSHCHPPFLNLENTNFILSLSNLKYTI